MTKFFIAFGVCALTMVVIDGVWLSVIARDFYQTHLGYLLADQINWIAAAVFYPIFVAGLVVFVVLPCLEKTTVLKTLLLGGFFGLVTYATYDLTNQAAVKNWPLVVTVFDMAWGVALAATVSLSGVFFTRLIGKRI